jgi:hypothetical protein
MLLEYAELSRPRREIYGAVSFVGFRKSACVLKMHVVNLHLD